MVYAKHTLLSNIYPGILGGKKKKKLMKHFHVKVTEFRGN